MKNSICSFSQLRFLSITLLALFGCTVANAADDECQAAGEYRFVCGPRNAEDLVLVPETQWIIASGMAPGAAIYLIDSQQKSWTKLYPGDAPLAGSD